MTARHTIAVQAEHDTDGSVDLSTASPDVTDHPEADPASTPQTTPTRRRALAVTTVRRHPTTAAAAAPGSPRRES